MKTQSLFAVVLAALVVACRGNISASGEQRFSENGFVVPEERAPAWNCPAIDVGGVPLIALPRTSTMDTYLPANYSGFVALEQRVAPAPQVTSLSVATIADEGMAPIYRRLAGECPDRIVAGSLYESSAVSAGIAQFALRTEEPGTLARNARVFVAHGGEELTLRFDAAAFSGATDRVYAIFEPASLPARLLVQALTQTELDSGQVTLRGVPREAGFLSVVASNGFITGEHGEVHASELMLRGYTTLSAAWAALPVSTDSFADGSAFELHTMKRVGETQLLVRLPQTLSYTSASGFVLGTLAGTSTAHEKELRTTFPCGVRVTVVALGFGVLEQIRESGERTALSFGSQQVLDATCTNGQKSIHLRAVSAAQRPIAVRISWSEP